MQDGFRSASLEVDDDGRLIMPAGVRGVGKVARALHKQRRDDRISHLRSIDHDALFVTAASDALGKPPVLPNLRCGVWYVPPSLSAGQCYFKSTDGHVGSWDFSLSRLNLQVALAAATHGHVMVVDSTRSGKRFPDALTKTVPIWCCVINRALAGDTAAPAQWDEALWLPSWVPASEAAQIEARLDGWVRAMRRPALAPLLGRLRAALDRPLRPRWLCPSAAEQGTATASSRSGDASSAEEERRCAVAASYAAEVERASAEASACGMPCAWVHCVCASEVCTAERARVCTGGSNAHPRLTTETDTQEPSVHPQPCPPPRMKPRSCRR